MNDAILVISDEIRDPKQRALFLLSTPGAFDILLTHIANGGGVNEFCKEHRMRFGDLYLAIAEDKDMQARYHKAIEARRAYDAETIIAQLRGMATSDVRDLFNYDGSLKHVNELTPQQAACISSVDVGSSATGDDLIVTKRIKLWDELKAIEMLGKHLGLFAERHVHEGTVTLRDLVLQSVNEEKAKETQKTGLLIKDK